MKRSPRSSRLFAALICVAATGPVPAAQAATPTTAWSGGTFRVDTANLVRRSNIVLGRAPLLARQSMNLGNGSFGVAAWAANGFTAQLNRADTLPNHRSAGQLVIPGLAAMTAAADYRATVDLYDATYRQSGGGMTATTYVRADKDEMVVDVTGADPSSTQTATIDLQSGRSATAAAGGAIATLSETWVDDATYNGPNRSGGGGSGKTFGSLAALTAGARDVTASTPAARTIRVTFTPNADGSFRIVVGAPRWTGGDAAATAASLLGSDATAPSPALSSAHLGWWHDFWGRAGLVKLSSSDGVANYMENIRTVYLYTAASSERGDYPSSQAGVNDLFSFTRDTHQWGGGDYWFWNLRMQLAANISSGVTELSQPFYTMYSNAIPFMESWTRMMWPLSQGFCVSETIRFDGTGWYTDGGTGNNACDSTSGLSYNKLTISTGAELASWIWRQYQATDDRAFLERYYPLIAGPTKFLLFSAKEGADGKLHTYPSNAHETQWGVHDPITDIAAMKMVFPIAVRAAQTLATDADLVTQLQAAIPKVLDFPRVDKATHKTLKSPANDGDGATVFGFSSDPAAAYHNSENLDLEPLWPYNLISDTSPLFNLAKETYNARMYRNSNSWTYDPVHAARLGLGDQVAATLTASTNRFQVYPTGLAAWNTGNLQEPYDEHSGVTALAINETLATDYDGLLRIAPAIPTGWDVEGTVFLQHRSKVHVQVQGGTVTTAVIESGADHDMPVRNPWPGKDVQVVDGTTVVVPTTQADTFTIPAKAGKSYIVQQPSAPLSSQPLAPLSGTPAAAARHLQGSNASIGLDDPSYQPPTPCDVPSGGTLVAWDPQGSGTVRDWSNYGRTGTFLRAPTFASEGPTGSAAAIGGGNYLTGGPTKLGYLREATLATEIKITASSSYRRIWDWKTSSGGDSDGIIVDLTPSGTLRVIAAGQNLTVNSALPTGRWINLVLTIAKDGALNVYVDGTRVGGGTFGTPGINGCADGATLRLGADQAGGQAITASFDRAAIFTTALSTADIARWQQLAFIEHTDVPGTVGGQVPPVLALTVGQPASFGTFQPGVAATYTSSLAASVISTAGNAALSVSDPSATAPGHLVNGGFVLPSPLQVAAGSGAFAPLVAGPLTLLTYDAPVSNSGVTVNFKQPIAATDGLRMGSYTKTLTFTLSTTTP
jgi:hypothetical protein